MIKTKLEKELEQKQKELIELKNKINNSKYEELKEKYGDDLKCDNCRYRPLGILDDHHSYCNKNECYWCNEYDGCEQFNLKNKISEYLNKYIERVDYTELFEIIDSNHVLDIDDELFPIVENILENLVKLEKLSHKK